jgi:NADH dehydrogenase [ubiquinone] 1 alpha subcomplex assembly factor 7
MKARGLGPLSQMQFLMALGLQTRLSKLIDNAPNDDRRRDLQQAVKRLIDPLGMGTQYQVMGVAPLEDGEAMSEAVYPFP